MEEVVLDQLPHVPGAPKHENTDDGFEFIFAPARQRLDEDSLLEAGKGVCHDGEEELKHQTIRRFSFSLSPRPM